MPERRNEGEFLLSLFFCLDIVESADQDVLNDSSELLKVKVYLIILNSG